MIASTNTYPAAEVSQLLTIDLADNSFAAPEEPAGAFDGMVDSLIAELLDTDGLDSIPTMEPLVDGFLYRDTLARIIGPSGHMKSFVALDMAAHVGTGRDWCGHDVRRGSAIYLVAEGAGGIRKRVRAWEQHHDCRMVGVKFLPRPVQAGDAIAWSVLTEACRRLEPSLVIFDTQARITVGIEENSSKEMGLVVERMDALRSATKACCTLIHHQGLQGDHGRGSTSVKGAMQTEIRVTKKGKKGPDARVVVSSDKQKDDEELDDVVFEIEVVQLDGEAKEDGSPVTSVVLVEATSLGCAAPESSELDGLRPAAKRVLAVLRASPAPLTVKLIGDELAVDGHPLKERTIQAALAELKDRKLAGDAESFGRTVWQATTGAVEVSNGL